MPINPDAVGASTDPHTTSWTSKDCLLYAVGVGAGATDPTGAELEFTTENTKDLEQRVLPTMPVILGGSMIQAYKTIGSFDPFMLVHGEQSVTLHRALPVDGSASVTTVITGIYDKGSGAVVASTTEGSDAGSGEALFTTTSSAFIRGEGGFGGDRGPSTKLDPPDKDPDDVVVYQTRPDQALLYRLSGDRNPLHSDPSFAALGGFDRPILHGLCTYGFTGRALLHSLCAGDPGRFRSMAGRFSKPVLPGDELTVRIWRTGSGEAQFATATAAGTVIDSGTVTFDDA